MIWFNKRKIIIPSTISINWCKTISLDGIIGLTNSNCNNLITLTIRGCKNIDDDCIIMIANHCINIEVLDISCCDSITSRGISAIAKSLKQKLLSLNMELSYDNEVSIDEGIINISNYCHNLQELNISGRNITTNNSITALARN